MGIKKEHETCDLPRNYSSLIESAAEYRFLFRDPKVFVAGFMAGVFIDIDHLVDYFIAFGWHFDLRAFRAGYQFLANPRMYVLFHSWELAVLLLAAAVLIRPKFHRALLFCLFLNMTGHLITDHVTNFISPGTYFLTYRLSRGFETSRLVTPDQKAEGLNFYVPKQDK